MRADWNGHCPSCTCGLTGIEWSDRSGLVDLKDPQDVAETIASVALDHYYDRGNGIPCGLPSELGEILRPVVDKYLSAIHPGWRSITVDMTDEQREDFEKALREAVTPFCEKQKGENT